MKRLQCMLLLLSAATISLGTEVNGTFDQGLTDYGDYELSCPKIEICEVQKYRPRVKCQCLRLLKPDKCTGYDMKGDPQKSWRYYKKRCDCEGKNDPESCCIYLGRRIEKQCYH